MMLDRFPTTKDFQANVRMRRNAVAALMVAAVFLVVGTMTAVVYFLPDADPVKVLVATFSILVFMAVPVIVSFRPRIGLYVLFIGALLFTGTHEVGVPTMPMTYVPFWWNLSTTGQVNLNNGLFNGLAVSPAEILMVLTFVLWIVRAVAMRRFRMKIGGFFWAIAAYMAMVAVGFVNGLTHGGDTVMALYEVRGQAYFFMTYLMAVNIIDDRRQLMSLLWTIVICNGIQGVCGTITFFVEHASITEAGFMAHDESLILNLIFFVAITAGCLGVDRRLRWAAICLSPVALIAILGNQRRASIAAFMIAFLPLIPMLWVILKEQRKQIGTLVAIFAAVSAIYMPLAWNSNSAWALPARSIRSQTDPNARDAASNTYRQSEEWDLIVTRDVSPIIGYGYGKKFLQPVPLDRVSTEFVYYMSHNSVLWVWMRLGHIGFFLFWLMVAVFIIRGIETIKTLRLPETRLVGLMAISMLLMMITFGKYDLALVDLRVLTITAVLLGALAILPDLEKAPPGERTVRRAAEQEDDLDDELISTTPARLGAIPTGGPLPF
jgi:hypothetical protein